MEGKIIWKKYWKKNRLSMLWFIWEMWKAQKIIFGIFSAGTVRAAGNNDFYTDLPGQAVIDLDGYRAFITHGHGYHVSYSPNRLVAEALHRNAQIAMYGHTHVPHLEQMEGVIVLNPGSLSYPRQAGREPSYIIMETTPDKQVHFDIRYLRK